MMTFKMDARLIHQQMSGEKKSSGPQRAAQLAGSMGGTTISRSGGSSMVWKLFKGLVLLAVLAAAALYALKELKILEL